MCKLQGNQSAIVLWIKRSSILSAYQRTKTRENWKRSAREKGNYSKTATGSAVPG
jgi:hypothetical protein